MHTRALEGGPWYREPWPWLLMAGPVVAVVGGAVTAWIAVTHPDGLVADDYYKQGLAINRTLDRERAAAALGVGAQMQVSHDGRRLRVVVTGATAPPDTLKLRLAHATVAGRDRQLVLAGQGGGWYEGTLDAPASGKWKLLLEDPAGQWRLTGIWQAGDEASATLSGRRD